MVGCGIGGSQQTSPFGAQFSNDSSGERPGISGFGKGLLARFLRSKRQQIPTTTPDSANCQTLRKAFYDHAQNYFVTLDKQDPDSKECVFGIGANHLLFGKLIVPVPVPSRDVWMGGSVYFPKEFRLPQQPSYEGKACYMGVHLWRLTDSTNFSNSKLQVDINIPAGSEHLQLYVFRPGKPVAFVKNTNYRPASRENLGNWQYWKLHANMGRPGKRNGYIRFYSDGIYIGGIEKQEFLPAKTDREIKFRFADLQSNISEGQCRGSLWPELNGWFVKRVEICTHHKCRAVP
jgi:hypothetical protein